MRRRASLLLMIIWRSIQNRMAMQMLWVSFIPARAVRLRKSKTDGHILHPVIVMAMWKQSICSQVQMRKPMQKNIKFLSWLQSHRVSRCICTKNLQLMPRLWQLFCGIRSWQCSEHQTMVSGYRLRLVTTQVTFLQIQLFWMWNTKRLFLLMKSRRRRNQRLQRQKQRQRLLRLKRPKQKLKLRKRQQQRRRQRLLKLKQKKQKPQRQRRLSRIKHPLLLIQMWMKRYGQLIPYLSVQQHRQMQISWMYW